VLDPGEIERIKALLDMDEEDVAAELPSSEEELENRKVEVIKQQLIADGLEIVDEEEIVEVLSKAPKRKKEKSKKRKKRKKEPKGKKNEVAEAGFEEALLAAVREMKVKKIKKLLKGAEVTLKIKFKDKE
jgi:hypothetical protein